MSTTTSEQGGSAEPRLIIPPLARFYAFSREASYPIIRATAGGTLLVHGIGKLTGSTTIAAFAHSSMAARGIEPAMMFAYIIWINETVGAACVILGLFTRLFAASIAIEMAILTLVFWPHGYNFTQPHGGYEVPLMWGLMFFAIALRGGGPYSLDRKLGREL